MAILRGEAENTGSIFRYRCIIWSAALLHFDKHEYQWREATVRRKDCIPYILIRPFDKGLHLMESGNARDGRNRTRDEFLGNEADNGNHGQPTIVQLAIFLQLHSFRLYTGEVDRGEDDFRGGAAVVIMGLLGLGRQFGYENSQYDLPLAYRKHLSECG